MPITETSHRPVDYTARHNGGKTGEIARYIQRKTMAGHPPTGTDADGCHFATFTPHTGQAWQPLSRQAQCRQYIQNDGFQPAQIPVQVRLVPS